MELVHGCASDGVGTGECIRLSLVRSDCIREVDEKDLLYRVSSTLNFLLAINVRKRRQSFFKLI